MASLTIRNLDNTLKARLILRDALGADDRSGEDLATAIRRRFAPLGGVELALPEREAMREPPEAGLSGNG